VLKNKGFTLIELMIVVVVLGIIAAIAFPAYTQYVQQTRRADATSSLLNAAQQLERCFTRTNSYAGCGDPRGERASSDRFYDIGGDIEEDSFTLIASPNTDGAQAGDPCVFELDHRGNRLPSPDDDPNRCWRR